ncbi:MAG: Bug family tripartite tricarboxylate transporter substrate binding protein [Burkholderiales bacterium]
MSDERDTGVGEADRSESFRGREAGGTRRDTRRTLLRAAASGIALVASGAHAQQGTAGWPAKPVRIVSPYPAGGSNDQVARVLAAKLGELWGQRVYVENKPGANNRIATQELARAAPDGYHLMLAAAPHGANPGLYDHKLPYDTLKDFVHLVRATVSPVGFFVPQAAPYRTMKELADAARAQPGRLFAGSPGNGSGPHMVIELWNWKTGARFEHLPMKGDAPLAVETVAGRVDVGVTGLAVMKPHLEAGRVRLLAVSSDRRFTSAPDVPTLAEAGFPAVDGFAWFGLVAPAGLPAELATRIARDASAVLAQPDVRTPLEAAGTFVSGGTPEQFAAFVAAEVDKWSQVAKATGMKPD